MIQPLWRTVWRFIKKLKIELPYEIELLVVKWMDLESVMQSEVSQKEKNKYHMLTHVYGIKKKTF